jgi:hypothetical protein
MKMMGIEFDPTLFKKRKGFRNIVIDGEMFQFNWADHPDGPMLILYNVSGQKIEISYSFGVEHVNPNFRNDTWHGKHKKEACFGGFGKPEAAELYRTYKKIKLCK